MAFANDPEYLDSLKEHMAATSAANAHAGSLRSKFGYDDEGIAEILGTIALWSEVTRFNIAAGVTWPETQRSPKETADEA